MGTSCVDPHRSSMRYNVIQEVREHHPTASRPLGYAWLVSCVAIFAVPSLGRAQVVDRAPIQTLLDWYAPVFGNVGDPARVSGKTILQGVSMGGSLTEGYVVSWRRGATGYLMEQRIWPTACWTGPVGTTQPQTGLNVCEFGKNLALEGDTAAVWSWGGHGAVLGQSFGLIHILRDSSQGWQVDQIIRPPAEAPAFGLDSMALDGGVLALGHQGYPVPGQAPRQGGVFLYERGATGRFELAEILTAPPNPTPHPASRPEGNFSKGMALHGGVLVGAERGHSLIHVFERLHGAWVLTCSVQHTTVNPFNEFGRAIAVDGHSGVMAASEGAAQGRVHVFERDPLTLQWSRTAVLNPLEGGANGLPAYFGTRQGTIAVRGDRIAVGANNGRVNGVPGGVVEVFRRGATGWEREKRLAAPIGNLSSSDFGVNVSLADSRVIVTEAGWEHSPGLWIRRVHVFELSEGDVACTGPGTVGLNVLFDDGDRSHVHLSTYGLGGFGFGYFVAGRPRSPLRLGSGALCVDQVQRLTGPLPFTVAADQLFQTVPHPDPTAPQSTAFQLVYRRQGPTSSVGTTEARFVN